MLKLQQIPLPEAVISLHPGKIPSEKKTDQNKMIVLFILKYSN